MERKEYIDCAKGVGIIFVLINHCCGYPFGSLYVLWSYYMALYFLLSGYTYTNHEESLWTFIKKKGKRLVIPYVVYNIFLFCYACITKIMDGTISWIYCRNVIATILYSGARLYVDGSQPDFFIHIHNEAMWFLLALFLTLLLWKFIEPFYTSVTNKVVVVMILFVLAFLGELLPVFLPWSLEIVPVLEIFFCLGIEIKARNLLDKFCHSRFLSFILVCIFYLVTCKINQPINLGTREYGNPGVSGIFFTILSGAAGSLALLYVCSKVEHCFFSKLFSKIGQCTITLLGLHLFFYELFDIFFLKIMKHQIVHFYAYSYFKILLTVICCIIINSLINMLRRRKHG